MTIALPFPFLSIANSIGFFKKNIVCGDDLRNKYRCQRYKTDSKWLYFIEIEARPVLKKLAGPSAKKICSNNSLFEDLALVEGFALQVITSPAQILVDQRLRLSRVGIQFFPIVGVVIDLPVR